MNEKEIKQEVRKLIKSFIEIDLSTKNPDIMIKVKNLKGTAPNECSCGSWLKHWEKFAGEDSFICSAKSCADWATDGAHVQKSNLLDNKWYIIPVCHAHNMTDSEYYVDDDTKFISANKAETCGK